MLAALFALAVIQAGPAAPDTSGVDQIVESLLENRIDDQDDASREQDAGHLVELLEDALHRRVPINTASEETLRGLAVLSEVDVRRIVHHRAEAGPLRAAADLLAAGLSDEAVRQLEPFITFNLHQPSSARRIRVDLIQRWSRRIDVGRGFQPSSATGSRYLGAPLAFQSRLRLRVGEQVSAGLTLDHDAGEPFVWRPGRRRLGPDYISLHGTLDGVGPVERLVAGSFSVQVGEGLVIGQRTAAMAAVRTATVDRLLRPHSSSREGAHFRGLAIQTRSVHGLTLGAFVSLHRTDGRLDTLDGSWHLAAAGAHRTPGEQRGRKLLRARTSGALFSFRFGPLHVGALTVYTRYGPDKPYRTSTSGTIFAGWVRPRWTVTAEMDPNLLHAAATAIFRGPRDVTTAIRFVGTRSGTTRVHSPSGVNSRGESLDMRAWDAEYSFRPFRSWTSATRFRYRVKARIDEPAYERRSVDTRLEFAPHRWLRVQVRGTSSSTEEAAACLAGRHVLRCSTTRTRNTARLEIEYRHSPTFRSRSRIELVDATGPAGLHQGFLIYEEVRWHAAKRLQLDLRLATFETSGTRARIHTFENDVLYAFSVPSFAGRGRRRYVLAHVRASSRLTLQLKMAVTNYVDVRTVGSGLDEVAGNRIREVKVQIRWKTD
ncbi:MAG: helix-hairpin-helix domain-containing protein [Rhodothermales bacterium]